MKGWALVWGAVLLILGFIFFWQNYPVYQQLSTSMGLLGRSLSPELQQRYEEAQMLVIFGSILAIVGFVTCIYGAVGAAPTPTVVTRVCPQCGRVLAFDVSFCPYCGKPLE